MQPSFPADPDQKVKWLDIAIEKIRGICQKADIVTLSHYHHDHYFSENLDIYHNKIVFAKNPNKYINNTQRIRGIEFHNKICKKYKISDKERIKKGYIKSKFPDPIDDLPLASSKDFGSYNKRREEVLYKGRKRFEKHVKKWEKFIEIPEIESNARSNFQTYTIYLEIEGIRDNMITEMKKKNIETQIGTYALHTQPVFKETKKIGSLQNSYNLYKNLLSLPLHHELTLEDQTRVVKELKNCLNVLS